MATSIYVDGLHDYVDRLRRGSCAKLHCFGKILLCDMQTSEHNCPGWINEIRIEMGEVPVDTVVSTMYTYRCIECGHESYSSEIMNGALKN